MPIACPRRKGLSVILGGSMLLNQFIVQTEDEHVGAHWPTKSVLSSIFKISEVAIEAPAAHKNTSEGSLIRW